MLLTHGDQCTKVPDGYHIIGKEGDGVVGMSLPHYSDVNNGNF